MSSSNQTFRGRVNLANVGIDNGYTGGGITTPGVEQTILDVTVAAGKSLALLQFFFSCRQPVYAKIEVDGTKVGFGRTNAINKNFNFNWLPYKVVNETQNLKIKIIANSWAVASDYDYNLQNRLI